MRKILITAAVGAALAVAPALAAKPASKPEHPSHPPHPARCKVNTVGYRAKGKLVEQTLTQTKGTTTATKSDDRWSGPLRVDVKKANHKAPTGEQMFTLTDAKVHWYDANHDGTGDTPVAGDTVRLRGKLTKFKKKCTPNTPEITVKQVWFKKAAPTT